MPSQSGLAAATRNRDIHLDLVERSYLRLRPIEGDEDAYFFSTIYHSDIMLPRHYSQFQLCSILKTCLKHEQHSKADDGAIG